MTNNPLDENSEKNNVEQAPSAVEKTEEQLKLEADKRQEELFSKYDGGRYKRRKYRMVIMLALLVIVVLVAIDAGRNSEFVTDKGIYADLEGFEVEVINNSDDVLIGWRLSYDGDKSLDVPTLPPEKSFKGIVPTEQTSGESVIYVHWQDDAGQDQKQVVLGYYEKGFDGVVTIKVQKAADGSFLIEPRSSYY